MWCVTVMRAQMCLHHSGRWLDYLLLHSRLQRCRESIGDRLVARVVRMDVGICFGDVGQEWRFPLEVRFDIGHSSPDNGIGGDLPNDAVELSYNQVTGSVEGCAGPGERVVNGEDEDRGIRTCGRPQASEDRRQVCTDRSQRGR